MGEAKTGVRICSLLLWVLLWSPAAARSDCSGCCTGHGGVVCRNRITMCADGSALSDECMKKECIKCPQGFFDGLDPEGVQKGIEIPDLSSPSSAVRFVIDTMSQTRTRSSDTVPIAPAERQICGPFDGKIKKCLYRGRLVYMNYGYPSMPSAKR